MQFVVCFRYLRDVVLILSQPLMELVQKSLWTIQSHVCHFADIGAYIPDITQMLFLYSWQLMKQLRSAPRSCTRWSCLAPHLTTCGASVWRQSSLRILSGRMNFAATSPGWKIDPLPCKMVCNVISVHDFFSFFFHNLSTSSDSFRNLFYMQKLEHIFYTLVYYLQGF